MSFLNKLMDSMRLSEDSDDDYFLDDDYEDDDKPAKKGLFKKDSYEDDYDEPEVQKPRFLPRATSNNKVVPMRRGMEVSLIKPTSLEDAREICDYLLAGKAVVLNMEGIHTETAQRIIDFTSGATYSMDGNLQKISNYTRYKHHDNSIHGITGTVSANHTNYRRRGTCCAQTQCRCAHTGRQRGGASAPRAEAPPRSSG